MKVDCEKIKKVGNRYYLLPSKQGEPMLAFNETCKIVIEELDSGKSIEDIVNLITNEYNVAREQAECDIRELMEQLTMLGILK